MNEEEIIMVKRRNDRYESLIMRFKSILEESKLYKGNVSNDCLTLIFDEIKKYTKSEKMTVSGNVSLYYRLEVPKDEEATFVNDIVSLLRETKEGLLDLELVEDRERILRTYVDGNINQIPEENREYYYDAVKRLVHLLKIQYIKDMEDELNEIKKDLIACMGYNAKVKKAKELEQVV